MTAQELTDELQKLLLVHPEAKEHLSFFHRRQQQRDHRNRTFPIQYLRYDNKHKRIVLEE